MTITFAIASHNISAVITRWSMHIDGLCVVKILQNKGNVITEPRAFISDCILYRIHVNAIKI